MTTSITYSDLYQRQITLIGRDAQEKIHRLKVLVIGAGGLGCPALQYLASAGVGKIGIVDFDQVSASNLQRQILYQINDIGKKKVLVVKERLSLLAPFCDLQVYPNYITADNAHEIISSYDLVLDCTDNFAAKFLIHDAAFKTRKILIQASVYQYEGQLQLFDFTNQYGPCLRCLWPTEPIDGCTGTCAEVGVMGPLLGVLGSMQAMEALKIVTGMEHLKNGETLFVDLLGLSFDIRQFKQVIDCPCCIRKEFINKENLVIDLPITLHEYTILDVRSVQESDNCSFTKKIREKYQYLQVPLEEISKFKPLLGQKYLTVCSRGIRSLKACQEIRKNHSAVYSLKGGTAFNMEINI